MGYSALKSSAGSPFGGASRRRNRQHFNKTLLNKSLGQKIARGPARSAPRNTAWLSESGGHRRFARVVPGLGGGDEGLVPLVDLRCALVADLAPFDERLGVRRASPAGGSASSAARAAPALRRALRAERAAHLICRDSLDNDVRRGATGIVRAGCGSALRNYRDVFERHQVDEHAGHVAARPIAQAQRTHRPDRARKRGHRGRPTPPKAPSADAAVPPGDATATQCANVAPGRRL